MNNDNRYEDIAQRSRTRRVRDFAFALVLGAVAALSVGAIRGAAANVEHAAITNPAPAPVQLSGASCTLEPAC
jgi:hypothetical protein